MPRHPRPSTPLPTVPPDPVFERLEKRIKPWQFFLGLVVLIFGAGVSFAAAWHGVAKVADVEQVRAAASTQLASEKSSAGAALGLLQSQVQDLRAHQAAIDASLTALSATTDHLSANVDRLVDQLIEVARATGARQLPTSRTATSSPPTRPP